MTNTAVGLLAHPIGFITGAILYAMILILMLQVPRKSVSRNVNNAGVTPLRRLSLWTAFLGLLWNVGGLVSFLLPAASPGWLHHLLHVTALSALGFLPAVVVHSFLQSGMRRRIGRNRHVLLAGAYALSTGAAAFNVLAVMPGTTVIAVEAMSLLAVGFVLLLAIVLADTVRQQGWDHHAGMLTLAVIAAAAIPFSHHQSGEYTWWMELIGHHASLPLAVAILYQDFRFAFGDIFLKRALSLMGLVGIAMGLYAGLGASQLERPTPFMDAIFIGLWVGTALLYPYVSRGASWVVDTVVLRRPDYEKFQDDVAQAITRWGTPEAIMDQCCAMLKAVLSTEEIVWTSMQEHEIDDGSPSRKPIVAHDAPHVIVEIPTVDLPRYCMKIGPLPHGRRLLSDDLYHLESLAHLLSRRITMVRVTHERCVQAFREQEIQKLATESELRALRAQLNPHFLFNALTTIGYLIQTSPGKAVDTLLQLTDLLRSVLKRLDKELTTVGHEMDLIQAYLAIEQMRFEDRMTVHIDVPESVRDVPIPALIVQPLVENAVKHGIQPSASGGRVRITAWIEEAGDDREQGLPSLLHLQVWNTGGEAGPVRNGNGQGTGLGLSNIKQRLLLHYGERATIDVKSSVKHGRTKFSRERRGATIDAKSSVKHGTVVNLLIPLDGHGVTHAPALPQGYGVTWP
ncbi:MAG: histidine kinase [Nitrospira sp.]|nr:histidine kinase [Nitrospira sp.]MDE0487123.1 histidine kinase [Nitrospira sp.]